MHFRNAAQEPLQVSWCAAIYMVLRDKRVSAPGALQRTASASRASGGHYLDSVTESIDNENLLDDGETDTVGRRNKRASAVGAVQKAPTRSQKPAVRIAHAFGTHCADTGALLLSDGTILYRSGRWLISQPIEAQERNGSGSTTLTPAAAAARRGGATH